MQQRTLRELEEGGIETIQNALLSKYTTFRIGGPAALLALPKTLQEVQACIKAAKQNNVPFFILGKGSNLLVSDEGYQGLVIHLGESFSGIRLEGEDVLVCQAGASLSAVCLFAAKHALSGLEFAYGIPGSAGGAAYMNAGAYGGEIADVFRQAEYLNNEAELCIATKEEASFKYRESLFQHQCCCIATVAFQLHKGSADEIEAKMSELLSRRNEKQPLRQPSAGSTFKRPQGAFAAKLIEDCGLKGFRIGGASVSEKHAGFVVNDQNATCADVLSLIEEVKKRVKEQTGIQLEPEVKFIG